MSETSDQPGKKPLNPGIANLRKGGGRPKGVPNRLNRDIRKMVADALDDCGGVAYLVERANDPKTAGAFLGLVGKILPKEVIADVAVKAEINWPVPVPKIES